MLGLLISRTTKRQARIHMEILEENFYKQQPIEPSWDDWLIYDNRPKIIERGIDFTSDVSTIKRHMFTEASRRSLDVTVRVLRGERLLFQVFSLDGTLPKLPDTSDKRKRYPWTEWLRPGSMHSLTAGEDFDMDCISMRAYVYKMATRADVRVHIQLDNEHSMLLVSVETED